MTGNSNTHPTTRSGGNPSSSTPSPVPVVGGRVGSRLNSRPLHPCPRCGKTFTKRSNMIIHERLHTGEMPYTCRFPGCGKKYKWLSSINFHENRCNLRTGTDPPCTVAPSGNTEPKREEDGTEENIPQIQGAQDPNINQASISKNEETLNVDGPPSDPTLGTGAATANSRSQPFGGSSSEIGDNNQHSVNPSSSDGSGRSSYDTQRSTSDLCTPPLSPPVLLPISSVLPSSCPIRKRSSKKNRLSMQWVSAPSAKLEDLSDPTIMELSSPVVVAESLEDFCPMVGYIAKSPFVVADSYKVRTFKEQSERKGSTEGRGVGKMPRRARKVMTKGFPPKTPTSPSVGDAHGTWSRDSSSALSSRTADRCDPEMAAARPQFLGRYGQPNSPESYPSTDSLELSCLLSSSVPGQDMTMQVAAPHLMMPPYEDEFDIPISPMTPQSGPTYLQTKTEEDLLDDFCLVGVELFPGGGNLMAQSESHLSSCHENGLIGDEVFGVGTHEVFSIDTDLTNETLLF